MHTHTYIHTYIHNYTHTYIHTYIHAYTRYTYYVRLGCFVSCLCVCVSSWREFSNRFGVGAWDSESGVCADVHAKLLLLSLRALMRGSLVGDQLGMEFFAFGGLNCEVVFFRRLWEITTCTRFLTGHFIIRVLVFLLLRLYTAFQNHRTQSTRKTLPASVPPGRVAACSQGPNTRSLFRVP